MSKPLPPSRSADQFIVRFPEGMRDRIAEVAKANNRSMNAEIVARLQSSFEESQGSVARVLPPEFRKQIESVLLDYIEQGKISAGKKPKG